MNIRVLLLYLVLFVAAMRARAMGPIQRSEIIASPESQVVRAIARPQDNFDQMIEKIQYQRQQQVNVQVAPGEPSVYVTQATIDKHSKDFDNIIVINKAPDQQNLTVYRFGQRLPKVYPVSTGLEQWACGNRLKDKVGNDLGGWDYDWTGTSTGYFPATWCDVDHRSNAYDDAQMTYACFFNRGIATHKGDPRAYGLLGNRRASHGCTRMKEGDAKEIYEMVIQSGGMPDLNHKNNKAQCAPSMKIPEEVCQSMPETRKRTARFQSEIQQMIDRGQQMQGVNGLPLPYAEKPWVPVIEPDGTYGVDKDTGASRKEGYRTLYIVQCVTKAGVDCSKRQEQQPTERPSQEECQRQAELEAQNKGKPMPPPLGGAYAPASSGFSFPNIFGRGFNQPNQQYRQPWEQHGGG